MRRASSYCAARQMEGAFKAMLEQGVVPATITYSASVSACEKSINVRKAITVIIFCETQSSQLRF